MKAVWHQEMRSGVAVAQSCRTSMIDRLMDRKIVSQNRLDKGVALVAILILLLCLSPMFWELASAVRQLL